VDRKIINQPVTLISTLLAALLASGCSDSSTDTVETPAATPFSLNFQAVAGDEVVNCDGTYSGFGMQGHHSVSVSDLRFYVSNVRFYDQDNNEIEAEFSDNDFQLNHDQGFVGLIDLTSKSGGACEADEGEGTSRTNSVISGEVMDTQISHITFDIGVPQAVMKEVISTTSAEDAPSPLNEMHWSWASGYRHLVMNFAIEDMQANQGQGFVHIGSRGCGDGGLLALENKSACDFVNSPTVRLDNFDIFNERVTLDISQILAGLMFTAHNSGGHGEHSGSDDMTMSAPSVTCHSAPEDMQPDCGPIFSNLGLVADDGSASAASNSVFSKQ